MVSIVQHLKDRHVDLSLYNPAIDEEERVATFMLYNLSGVVCGYQQYRPDADKKRKNHPREGRYYTYRSPGQVAVFGLETYHRPGPLFLTEGLFDAVRIHNLGLAGIGTLSNDPKHILPWLRTTSRKKVAICDPGQSGAPLAKHADEAMLLRYSDLGDMTDADVRSLLAPWLTIDTG